MHAHNFIDLSGERFTRLLVIEFLYRKGHDSWWKCLCDCGNVVAVRMSSLRGEVTKSCGCIRNEKARLRWLKHGQAGTAKLKGTKEYNAWMDAKHRVSNPKNNRWQHYGGSGKRMCAGWLNGFDSFFSDLGPCPKKYSLHRINNDGHYSCGHCEECKANGWPLNCRWDTILVQANNKKGNRFITFRGKTQTVAQWARELGVQAPWIYTRLYRGWSEEQTLSYFSVDSSGNGPNVTPV